MGAEVVVSVGYMNGYEYEEDKVTAMDGNETQSRRTLITRDLLGVGIGVGIGAGAGAASNSLNNNDLNSNDNNHKIEYQGQHHELDLDLQVPTGWEKRLDLQSGKIYLQKCNSTAPTSSSYQRGLINHCVPKLQDLNCLHPLQKPPLNLFDDAFLDLKLVPSSSSSSSSAGNYNSVCTLDKVRYALERAEKEPNIKKRSPFWKPSSLSPSPSPSHSSSSSHSMKETIRGEDDNEENVLLTPIAAGCPSCLLYVLISVKDPKCPSCNVPVPLPNSKKPRIDLNMSM